MKTKILFVDDDEDIIAGYKRMLHSKKNIWDVSFANGGAEALEKLAGDHYNIVMSDMKMPKMDGVELLAKIKKNFPYILRIIISGQMDEKKAVDVSGVAHQFISKPAAPERIISIIEKASFWGNYVRNENLIKFVTEIGELPGLTEVYLKIENELKNDDVPFEIITKLISKDISLSVKILQLVNSSFFGLQGRITDLNQALSYLGLNTIKAIILHLSLYTPRNLNPSVEKLCKKVADHSLLVGILAKAITAKELPDKTAQDDSFISGILYDIGKVILVKLNEYEEKISSLQNQKNITFESAEKEVYGFTHSEVGAYLLGIWGLPAPIVETAAFHHNPSNSFDNQFSALTSVHVAHSLIESPAWVYNKIKSKLAANEQIELTEYSNLFKNLDFEYLKKINVISKIQSWIDIYLNFYNNQIEES